MALAICPMVFRQLFGHALPASLNSLLFPLMFGRAQSILKLAQQTNLQERRPASLAVIASPGPLTSLPPPAHRRDRGDSKEAHLTFQGSGCVCQLFDRAGEK